MTEKIETNTLFLELLCLYLHNKTNYTQTKIPYYDIFVHPKNSCAHGFDDPGAYRNGQTQTDSQR